MARWDGKERRQDSGDRLILEVPKGSNLDEILRLLVSALKGSGGNNSGVLTAINNLDRKVSEFMSTQETRLQGIQSALTSIAAGINTLQQQVADLKANNPELEDEISSIEGTVKAIADDINGVAPDTGGVVTGDNS